MASLDDMTVNITFVTNLITMNKKYQTRDGREVRILATDFKAGATCVIGTIILTDDNEIMGLWSADGRSFPWGSPNNSDDLIPVPTKHEVWVIVQGDQKIVNSAFYSHDEAYELTVGHPYEHIGKLTWETE